MEKVQLSVKRRKGRGTSASRKDRSSGYIPGVLYGKGFETLRILVETETLRSIYLRHGTNVLVDIVDDETKKTHTTMIKELQTDHLGHKLLHADFYLISMDKPIEMDVPVHVEGRALGELDGGIVEQIHHQLSLICMPADMPDHITVRIDELGLGDSLRVRDIHLPENITINAHKDEPVVSIVAPRAVVVEQEVEGAEVTPTVEGEEAVTEPEVISQKGEREEEGEKS